MEQIIIAIIIIVSMLILAYAFNINIKKAKQIAEKNNDKEILEELKKLPSNIEICKEILQEFNNPDVEIVEDKKYNTSLYTIYNNTITIGTIKNKIFETQTIAHECIHSVQSKRTQKINFIISNIYIMFFYGVAITTILSKIFNWNNIITNNQILITSVLLILSFFQFTIRSLLETEAILEAKHVAKKYYEKIGIKPLIIDKIMEEYTEANQIGINIMHYTLFTKNMIKVLIYVLLVAFIKII